MPIGSSGHVPLPPLHVAARPAYGGSAASALELVDNSKPCLVFVLLTAAAARGPQQRRRTRKRYWRVTFDV
jgi:hypothetical protein